MSTGLDATTLAQDARAVLLPISDSLTMTDWVAAFLRGGGRSVLVASSGEEYAARRISDERRAAESAHGIRDYVAAVREEAGTDVLVAVDAEPTGVQRLEHLLPELPGRDRIGSLTDEQLRAVFGEYARAARELGVTLFLSPVLDEITGENPWLRGRIMGDDLETIARIGVAYAEAVQAEGITATAKHFPGHSDLFANPVFEDITLRIPRAQVERNLLPFARMIGAGVGAVMVGPVTVEALDPTNPAATSNAVISLLRDTLGFEGLIISDDLDAASTLKGASLADTVVRSIAAGVELLLVPGGDSVRESAEAVTAAIDDGRLTRATLAAAAAKVRSLGTQHATAPESTS